MRISDPEIKTCIGRVTTSVAPHHRGSGVKERGGSQCVNMVRAFESNTRAIFREVPQQAKGDSLILTCKKKKTVC